MNVTVLTASLPEREGFRSQCVASVANQTLLPERHLISINHARVPQWANKDRLGDAVDSEWMCFFDDDDVMYPNFLEAIAEAASKVDADVFSPWCDGGDFTQYNMSEEVWDVHCRIAHCSVFRSQLWHDLNGFKAMWAFDLDFWRRAKSAGARFCYVTEPLFQYRQHAAMESHKGQRQEV